MIEWTPPPVASDILPDQAELVDARSTANDQLRDLLASLPSIAESHDAASCWRLGYVPGDTSGEMSSDPSTDFSNEASNDSLHEYACASVLTLTRPDGVHLSVDFTRGKARHRAQESGGGIQTLARALGITAYRRRHGRTPTVVDATGGLGQDAWALASLAVDVRVYEQHPIVHALLADGLLRARAHPDTCDIATRIHLEHDAAEHHLPGIRAHAIHLDPMYPARQRKKADSRKGMQFLHALLGPPSAQQNARLLPAALSARVNRVVVKRPRGAEALPGAQDWHGQITEVSSRNTRYDVYHLHRE